MLGIDEIGSNLPPMDCILLRKLFSLVLIVFAQKTRKSLVLMERKAIGMSFEEEKRSDEVPGARKARK